MTPSQNLVGSATRLLTLLALGGCAATASPQWDAAFGDSARTLSAQQVLDPAAPTRNGQKNPPVDGRATREATDRQTESYRAPPPSSVINIGVGSGR